MIINNVSINTVFFFEQKTAVRRKAEIDQKKLKN